jgi:hypothetical protein
MIAALDMAMEDIVGHPAGQMPLDLHGMAEGYRFFTQVNAF